MTSLLTAINKQHKLNERELASKTAGTPASWHADFKDSDVVLIAGLPAHLTDRAVEQITSQFGTPTRIHRVLRHIRNPRGESTAIAGATEGDKDGFTGRAYVRYADQRSTILAVDNLTGTSVTIDGQKYALLVSHVDVRQIPAEMNQPISLQQQQQQEQQEQQQQQTAAESKLEETAGKDEPPTDDTAKEAKSEFDEEDVQLMKEYALDPNDPLTAVVLAKLKKKTKKKTSKKRKTTDSVLDDLLS